VAAHYVAALQDGTPRSWTLDWTHEDGGIVSYEAHCYRIADRHLAVFFEDVSERRRIERELARHVRELERSNRDLDEFAYIASHDLKSPLRDIHNLATWVSEDLEGQVPEGTARHLALMRDRVSRMEQLLDDLLQYSRAGRVNAQVEDVRVATAIESAVAILDLGGHALRIHADNSTVRAPRAAVELVLRNLVANSIRHHDRPAGVVEIDVRPEPGQVCVEVRDDGPGIPPEHAERVFRMFQTLRPREDGGGNGMGLAVVKKVMESCGGRVELHSNGRGTTMRTYWPVGRER
jgi:signal transduction histidine kinase